MCVRATRVNDTDTGVTAPKSHHTWKRVMERDLGPRQRLAGIALVNGPRPLDGSLLVALH